MIDFIYLWEHLFYHPSLLAHSIRLKGLISLLPFTTLFYHPLLRWLCLLPCNILLYPSSFLNQGLVFFLKLPLSSSIALSFHATMDMISYPHSLLWEGVHFPISFQKSFLDSSILHFSPIPNLRKRSFDHSFLSQGIDFFALFNSFFYHPSLIYKSMLCDGVAVALMSSFLLLSCLAPSFHAARDMLFYPHSLLREGLIFTYFSKIRSRF